MNQLAAVLLFLGAPIMKRKKNCHSRWFPMQQSSVTKLEAGRSGSPAAQQKGPPGSRRRIKCVTMPMRTPLTRPEKSSTGK